MPQMPEVVKNLEIARKRLVKSCAKYGSGLPRLGQSLGLDFLGATDRAQQRPLIATS